MTHFLEYSGKVKLCASHSRRIDWWYHDKAQLIVVKQFFFLAGVDWHWLVKWLLTGDREINRNYYRWPIADVQIRNEGNIDL
jgi:hypothetical protein